MFQFRQNYPPTPAMTSSKFRKNVRGFIKLSVNDKIGPGRTDAL